MINVIRDLEEVGELDQACGDNFRRVFKRLELCHVSHSDSIRGLHQALSSLVIDADFLNVFMVGRHRSVWLVPGLLVLFFEASDVDPLLIA